MSTVADWFRATLLGIIQGATEFLPVSSSGHLALGNHLVGLNEHELALTVWLHLGTLLAVCWVYRAELIRMARGDFALVRLVMAGFVPTAVIGLIARPVVEGAFESLGFVGLFFLVTAAALVLGEARLRRTSEPQHSVSVVHALVVGVVQSLALLPGVSRSGITIAAALCMGISRPVAAHFSFLLSIPVIAGATAVEVPELWAAAHDLGFAELAIGLAASFLSGLFALRWLLRLVPNRSLLPFAAYCALLGLVVLLLHAA